METWTAKFQFAEPNKRTRSNGASVCHHTVILQPLGHVHSLDVCRLLERPHIQNELMSYKTCKGRKGKLNRMEENAQNSRAFKVHYLSCL